MLAVVHWESMLKFLRKNGAYSCHCRLSIEVDGRRHGSLLRQRNQLGHPIPTCDSSNLMDPKIKNRSRMWYQMANIEVAQVEGDNNWALLIDPDGYIAEGTGDNFFMIKNECLILDPRRSKYLTGHQSVVCNGIGGSVESRVS